MDLQELLSTKEINKKVDDDLSYKKGELFGFSETPKEVKDIQVNTETSMEVIIKDLSDLSDITRTEAENLYASILAETPRDEDFNNYLELVGQYTWDPMSLAADPESRPDPTIDYKTIQNYELVWAQQYNNPAVLFLSDIRRVISEAGYIKYLSNYAWDNLQRHYKNENNDTADNLIRIHLFTEIERLNQKRLYLNAIKTSNNVKIANSFLTGLLNSVNLTVPSGVQELGTVLTNNIRTLQALRPYFKIFIISSSYKWLDFKSILNDLWGTYYTITMASYTRSFTMAAASFINNGIFDLIESLENLSSFDISGTREAADFKNMVNSVLQVNLSSIEQELVQREVKENTTHHTRYLKLLEAQKITKAKKYLDLLDEVILQLELLRANLNNTNNYNQFELNKMVLSLQEKLVNQDTKRKPYVT